MKQIRICKFISLRFGLTVCTCRHLWRIGSIGAILAAPFLACLLLIPAALCQSKSEQTTLLEYIDIPRFTLGPGSALFLPTADSERGAEVTLVAVDRSFPAHIPLGSVLKLRTYNASSSKKAYASISFSFPDKTKKSKIDTVIVKRQFRVSPNKSGLVMQNVVSNNRILRSGWLLGLVTAKGTGAGRLRRVQNLFLVRRGKRASQPAGSFPKQPIVFLADIEKLEQLEVDRNRSNTWNSYPERVCRQIDLIRASILKKGGGGPTESPDTNLSPGHRQDGMRTLIDAETLRKSPPRSLEAIDEYIRFSTLLAQRGAAGKRDRQLLRRQGVIICQTAYDDYMAGRISSRNRGKRDEVLRSSSTKSQTITSTKSPTPVPATHTPAEPTPTKVHSTPTVEPLAPTETPSTPISTPTPKHEPSPNTPDDPYRTPTPISTPSCFKYDSLITTDNEQKEIQLSWQTYHGTGLYKIEVFKVARNPDGSPARNDGRYQLGERVLKQIIDLSKELRETHSFTAAMQSFDIYLVTISEKNKKGAWDPECRPRVAQLLCPAFREPEISLQSSKISVSNLLLANATDVIVYATEGNLPSLLEADGKYTSAENKACAHANKLFPGSQENSQSQDHSTPYSKFIKRQVVRAAGPFTSNDNLLVDDDVGGEDRLVCVFLCPNCASKARFDSKVDASIVAAYFNDGTKYDSFLDVNSTFPRNGSRVPSATFFARASAGPASSLDTYSVTVKSSVTGENVFAWHGLLQPALEVGPLRPGAYISQFTRHQTNGSDVKGIRSEFTIKYPIVSVQTELGSEKPPTLTWESREVNDQTTYQLAVASTSDPTVMLFNSSGITTKSFQFSDGILDAGKYFVWIRQWQEGIPAKWGAPTLVEVKDPTASVGEIYQQADVTVFTIETTLVPRQEGSLEYQLWVRRIKDNKLLYNEVGNQHEVEVPPIPSGTIIEVSVRARQQGASKWDTKWSSTIKVTVPDPSDPQKPHITVPVFDRTESTHPSFAVTEVRGASSYQLWIDNLSTGVKARVLTSTKPKFNSVDSLEAGDEIMVWVRAKVKGSWSRWQIGRKFIVTEEES